MFNSPLPITQPQPYGIDDFMADLRAYLEAHNTVKIDMAKITHSDGTVTYGWVPYPTQEQIDNNPYLRNA